MLEDLVTCSNFVIVYTCQKRRGMDCKFFLWDDDAKTRSRNAVLSNSRTEPVPPNVPATPSGRSSATLYDDNAPRTPYSNSKAITRLLLDTSPSKQSKQQRVNEWLYDPDDEFYDEDLKNLADKASMPPPLETPRKSLPTTPSSLGKRHFEENHRNGGYDRFSTPRNGDDVFVTPNSKFQKRDLGQTAPGSAVAGPGSLMTPGDTERTSRTGPPLTADGARSYNLNNRSFRDESPLGRKSTNFSDSTLSFGHISADEREFPSTELATELLDALRDCNIELTVRAMNAVKRIARDHVQEMQNMEKEKRVMEKSRDVSREAFKRRNERVKELEVELARLKELAGQMAK